MIRAVFDKSDGTQGVSENLYGDETHGRVTNHMTYRGHSSQVIYDGIDDILVGRLLGVDKVVEFRARDLVALRALMVEAVGAYIDPAAGRKVEPVVSDADIEALFAE